MEISRTRILNKALRDLTRPVIEPDVFERHLPANESKKFDTKDLFHPRTIGAIFLLIMSQFEICLVMSTMHGRM